MSYGHLRQNQFARGAYELVPYREQDIFQVMHWRNQQIDVLRQRGALTEADQRRYYDSVVAASFSASEPRLMLFSYLHARQCIGYGGLTNIDWQAGRAEISFLADSARAADPVTYERDFATFLELVKELTFQATGLNRLFTETFDIRPAHVAILEGAGFRLEGRLREHARVGERRVDSLLHGLLRSDHESASA
jgi:RimJ/RimL family protein N-acetyltransferase